MNFPRFCKSLASLTIALAVFSIAGCGDGSTDEAPKSASNASSVLGTYVNANDGISFELLAGNRALITDGEYPSEQTWEMDGADKVVIHIPEGVNLVFTFNSDGNLSDGMGGVYIRQ